MKEDFWTTLIFFLLFMIFATGSMFWGGYVTIGLVWLVSTLVGAAVIAYLFRPDRLRRS